MFLLCSSPFRLLLPGSHYIYILGTFVGDAWTKLKVLVETLRALEIGKNKEIMF